MTHEMPEHLPELPSGWVYAGRLRDYPYNGPRLEGVTLEPGSNHWSNRSSWIGMDGACGDDDDGSGEWHYAVPTNSDLGRKILAERGSDEKFGRERIANAKAEYWQDRAAFWRDQAVALGYVPDGDEPTGKPDWSEAPSWAEWLAQDADGGWAWFEDEPTNRGVPGMWVRQDGQKGETEEVDVDCEHSPHWRSTLERRPESTKVGKLHVEIDESEARRVVDEALEDAFEDIPDMIIPKDAAAQIEAYSFISDLARIGYRLEVDSDGIRGWKED